MIRRSPYNNLHVIRTCSCSSAVILCCQSASTFSRRIKFCRELSFQKMISFDSLAMSELQIDSFEGSIVENFDGSARKVKLFYSLPSIVKMRASYTAVAFVGNFSAKLCALRQIFTAIHAVQSRISCLHLSSLRKYCPVRVRFAKIDETVGFWRQTKCMRLISVRAQPSAPSLCLFPRRTGSGLGLRGALSSNADLSSEVHRSWS